MKPILMATNYKETLLKEMEIKVKQGDKDREVKIDASVAARAEKMSRIEVKK